MDGLADVGLRPADLEGLGPLCSYEDIARESDRLASLGHRRLTRAEALNEWKRLARAADRDGRRPPFGEHQRAAFLERSIDKRTADAAERAEIAARIAAMLKGPGKGPG